MRNIGFCASSRAIETVEQCIYKECAVRARFALKFGRKLNAKLIISRKSVNSSAAVRDRNLLPASIFFWTTFDTRPCKEHVISIIISGVKMGLN
jgi:hypothetical protein